MFLNLFQKKFFSTLKNILNTKKVLTSVSTLVCLATSYSRRGKPPTTIGAKELNFCVRHGNRCDLFAIITRLSYKDVRTYALQHGCCELSVSSLKELFFQNWINMDMKVYLVKSSTYQYSSTPYIAALPSRTYLPDRLSGVLLTCVMGNLILRGASCLDAFSTYPVHTQLPSDAFGKTTGTPAVCPSRSSRTKDSSSQISYAHDGQGPNCLTTF